MHLMKRLVIASAITMVGLAATGCAQPGSAASSTDLPVEQINAGRILFNEINTAIDGTPQSRYLGEVLSTHKIQTWMRDCMKDQGLDYDVRGYTGALDPVLGPPNDLVAFAPITDTYGDAEHLADAYAAKTAVDADWDASVTEQPGYVDALASCEEKAPAGLYDHHLPASHTEATLAFLDVLGPVNLDEGLQDRIADWLSCMDTKGRPITPGSDDPGAYWIALRELVTPKFPADPADPSFAEAAENEKAVAAADSECRQDLSDHAMGLLAEPLAEFKTSHAELLARISGEWIAITTEAEALN